MIRIWTIEGKNSPLSRTRFLEVKQEIQETMSSNRNPDGSLDIIMSGDVIVRCEVIHEANASSSSPTTQRPPGSGSHGAFSKKKG